MHNAGADRLRGELSSERGGDGAAPNHSVYCCGGSATFTTAPYVGCKMRIANCLTDESLSVDRLA